MKANKKEISEATREKVVKYSQKGWSQVKIAKNFKCSRSCVQYTLKRFVETGANKNRKNWTKSHHRTR
jgi:transposase